jgi:polyisoprenoid-binding protein YceI
MTLKRVLIGLVILGVIGGGVLFVLDRTIFAPVAVSTAAPVAPTLAAPVAAPTSAPTIAAASQPTTAPASTTAPSNAPANDPGAQLYQIDPAQSEVRYQVNETFFQGNRLNTAVGRTKGIAGELSINFAQPTQSQIGEIVIDISQFTSDESRRDNFIRRQGLESATYPTATFKTTSITGLPDKVSVGDQITFQMTGDLTVKHTTKPVTWDVTLKVGDNQLTGSATTQILMSDFGVGPLQLPILATEDQVKLFFDFVAVPAAGG